MIVENSRKFQYFGAGWPRSLRKAELQPFDQNKFARKELLVIQA